MWVGITSSTPSLTNLPRNLVQLEVGDHKSLPHGDVVMNCIGFFSPKRLVSVSFTSRTSSHLSTMPILTKGGVNGMDFLKSV